MIGMLVGNQDGGEGFGILACGMEALKRLLAGEAGVD
jgi:hypothetical protein